MVKRDNTIDSFRGFAALWIIFIHTCFWSGEAYVPTWLQSVSLIIDVPLFVFISGMTFNFNNDFFKSIKGIVKIWYKWLIFLILYFGITLVVDRNYFSVRSIIEACFFHFESATKLKVVYGSLWFIFMFFVVSIVGNLIICLYNKKFKDLKNFKYILILTFLFYGMDLYNDNFIFLSTNVLLYTFIYLLGYYLYNFKFKSFKAFIFTLISVILILIILLNFNNFTFLNMQGAKGANHINYFIYSLISITIVTYLKDIITVKKNPLCFVGTNALVFYFCQGLSSSAIHLILPIIRNLDGPFILVIMLLSNILIACILSLLLIYGNKLLSKFKINICLFESKEKDL